MPAAVPELIDIVTLAEQLGDPYATSGAWWPTSAFRT